MELIIAFLTDGKQATVIVFGTGTYDGYTKSLSKRETSALIDQIKLDVKPVSNTIYRVLVPGITSPIVKTIRVCIPDPVAMHFNILCRCHFLSHVINSHISTVILH